MSASDCVPMTTQGMSCSQRTGVNSGPMRAGEEPLLTNAAASSQEGICHRPFVSSSPRGSAGPFSYTHLTLSTLLRD